MQQTDLEQTRRRVQWMLAGLVLIAGGAIGAGLVVTRPQPAQRLDTTRVPAVAVETILPQDTSVAVVGHGSVRPKNQVDIVPQVSGRLNYVHPSLATGKTIPKGELLFEVDSTVYESRKRQAEAEVRGLEATLARHDEEAEILVERISSMEQMVAIERQDYDTSLRLYQEERVGTQRDVDQLYQKYLRQHDALTELRGRRAMIPHVRQETEASLEAARARLRQAEYDLENTRIVCPFKARVEDVHAYRSQVVTAHFSIARLTDMEAFELAVGIDPRELRWLDEAIRPQSLGKNEDQTGPAVTVRWSLHGQNFTWRGFVTRFERVDEVTRTARLVVEVREADMTATASNGKTETPPQLAIGMFCRAELPATRLQGALFVPRHAIYDNRWVYVVVPDSDGNDAEREAVTAGQQGIQGRLARREISLLRSVGEKVLVDFTGREGTEVCELRPGEQVVVSPLLTPVIGMPVRIRDSAAFGEAVTHNVEPSPEPVWQTGRRWAVLARRSLGPWFGGG